VELQDHPDEPVEPIVGRAPDRSEPGQPDGNPPTGVEPSDAGPTGAERVEDAGRRRRPSTIGGAVYLVVLAGAGVGVGIVSHGSWRLGVKWVAASLVVAAMVRLALPSREAGMLAVRRRLIDVGLLAAVGVTLWFLSTSIPNQPLP
jgi:hypothetical protein